MPLRHFTRQQAWLLPPTLGDLVPADHPARFVAEFVDNLEPSVWQDLDVNLDGEAFGAPAYHPRALLSVWLYGFMTGVRSSRKLETACRDQVPYLWLTGWQHPDHNTLWRFYQAHRQAMRKLLKYTVATALELDLLDLAIQAVDGTKLYANAARDRTYDRQELQKLLDRTEAAITELESQNTAVDEPATPKLPTELQQAQDLRQHVREAMQHLSREKKYVNLTDGDAQLMKAREGIIAGYNAQAMVSPLNPATSGRTGMLITAAEVVCTAADSGQLVPMMEQSEETTGERTPVTLADGGYHTIANLKAGEEREQTLVMTERYREETQTPFFKDRFTYDGATDTYLCPRGQPLPFRGIRQARRSASGEYRLYRASSTSCRSCSAFGVCTRDKHGGRALWISAADTLLRKHRQWMKTEEARNLYALRQQLSEPTFGILKEQMGARRLLLRGLDGVRAEFGLLSTAFNLRTLWQVWKDRLNLISSLQTS